MRNITGVSVVVLLSGIGLLLSCRESMAAEGVTEISAPPPPLPPAISVRIPVESGVFWGMPVEVPIFLDTTTVEFSGFNLLITFESDVLTFLSANNSDSTVLPVYCGWEYFTYGLEQVATDSGTLVSVLRLTAVANADHKQKRSRCNHPRTPTKLATVRFLVANDRNLECYFSPIRFLWATCEDNTITGRHRSARYISSVVRDFDGSTLPGADSFPTYFGAPALCDSLSSKREPMERAVTFKNGGVEIICADPIDARGDVNLNGISYECADYIMFRNYFLYGLAAFQGHADGSMAASDVNGDGLTLAVADMVILRNVMLGLPGVTHGNKISPNQTLVHYNQSTGNLTFETPDTLGAMYFTFAGDTVNITVNSGLGDRLSYHTVDGVIRVMLASSDCGRADSIFSGTLFTITPPLPLRTVEVATIDGKMVTTVIDSPSEVDVSTISELPVDFVLWQNHPNPFNLSTTIGFDLPKPTVVHIEIINSLGQIVHAQTQAYGVGTHRIEWNGTDDKGRIVSSGVYYFRLSSESYTAVRKMVLLK